jgi:MSHA biogenesis protein MshO
MRRHTANMRRHSATGFTMVELVVVITLCAICATFMTMFVVKPVDAYVAQTQRANLVDAADSALRLLSRDLRSALPNSVRVTTNGSVAALEMLATIDGARYNNNGATANAALWLDFSQADGAFSTTVPFSTTYPASTNYYLAIYNIGPGVTGANAYAIGTLNSTTPNVITPPGTTITIATGATANAQLVTLSPATFQFALGSPNKRVYLVNGPVSYLCDTSVGTLTRYAGYSIGATQPSSAAALAAATSVGSVATNVGNCNFTYTSGSTYQRGGMATLTLQLTNGGQEVQLVQQVHLVNAP